MNGWKIITYQVDVLKILRLLLGVTACVVLLSFCGSEVFANGVVSVDAVPQAVRKSVRKANVKRAPQKKIKVTQKQSNRKPLVAPKTQPQPTSLERGIALLEQERYSAARPWLQKAVQEERRNPYAWYWFGQVHEKMGQFEQAQFFYTKSLELDPTFPPLSRVVAFPDDGERKPLWDPLRPARVYPIPTNDLGVAIVPPDSPQATRRPARPAVDPNIPNVPVYLPPEPLNFVSGDAVSPPVYVPPPASQKK